MYSSVWFIVWNLILVFGTSVVLTADAVEILSLTALAVRCSKCPLATLLRYATPLRYAPVQSAPSDAQEEFS